MTLVGTNTTCCATAGWGTNTKIRPLPTINNLPPGAPLAVNAHATPGPLILLSG